MRNRWKATLIGLVAACAVAGSAAVGNAAICGDLNGNGSLDPGDATLLLQVAAGVHPNPAALCGGMGATQCGDMNASGSVTVGDAPILLNLIVGNPTLFQCTGVGALVPCGSTLPNSINSNRKIQKCTGNCQSQTAAAAQNCSAFINGTTFVEGGVTLSIDPGAVVCGVKGAPTPSVLVFRRDAKINAVGDACSPILFTSNQAENSKAVGDWGGVIFNGRGPVNCTIGGVGVGACLAEGIDGVEFGGTNPADFSGRAKYVRVEFSGFELSPDNELNIFTQNGLGSATDFSFIQAHMGLDDAFEWFGGNLNENHLVATYTRDDFLDWQLGYTGTVQFALAAQRAASTDSGGRNGIEADNNENGEGNSPRSNGTYCNLTLVGAKGQGDATAGRDGMLLRRGTDGVISNSIIMDWSGAGVEINGANAQARACLPARPLRVQNSLFFNNGTGGTVQILNNSWAGSCVADGLTYYNTIGAPEFSLLPATGNAAGPSPGITTAPLSTLGAPSMYVPASATADLSAPDCAALNPDVFVSAPYKGAFAPGGGSAANWMNSCPVPAAGQCSFAEFDVN